MIVTDANNVAIEVGGVCLAPGDYVYADRSGGVVIPADSLRAVLDEARRIEVDDLHDLEQIRREDTAAVVRGGT